ncbi:MAG: TlpA disulfide reductase family protein [Actinomycetota bacterium]
MDSDINPDTDPSADRPPIDSAVDETDAAPTSPNWPMIIGGAIVAIAVVVGLALFAGGGEDATDVASSEIRDLEFLNEDGTTGTLAQFEGQPVVVNFFASWCAPCRGELPEFEKTFVDGGGDVLFVGVSHDFDEASWRSFEEEFALSYPTVFQPNTEIWTTLGLFGTPATIFIAPDGEVLHEFTGVLTEESLKDLIAEHLDVEI